MNKNATMHACIWLWAFSFELLQFPYKASLTRHGRVEHFDKFVKHHTVFLTYEHFLTYDLYSFGDSKSQ
jgi:hypothetical protein